MTHIRGITLHWQVRHKNCSIKPIRGVGNTGGCQAALKRRINKSCFQATDGLRLRRRRHLKEDSAHTAASASASAAADLQVRVIFQLAFAQAKFTGL